MGQKILIALAVTALLTWFAFVGLGHWPGDLHLVINDDMLHLEDGMEATLLAILGLVVAVVAVILAVASTVGIMALVLGGLMLLLMVLTLPVWLPFWIIWQLVKPRPSSSIA
ncbi:hypothetical protein [Gallaecimonas sp. GXIMD4217]|uniref:hypothetical protein n=1 Tax=Gallaecimonas sp. GXIMD4217 TaxID=3131927 RepID=UPI00311ABD0F